jgi:hypothetical protein
MSALSIPVLSKLAAMSLTELAALTDRSNDRADAGMEGALVSRNEVSSSPLDGDGGNSELAALFSYGEKDYYLGGSPSGNCSASHIE